MGAHARSLPAVSSFFDGTDQNERLLQGTQIKWDNKVWTPAPREGDTFLVTEADFALQMFDQNGKPKVIRRKPGESLPDPDQLNDEIGQENWRSNKFTGAPEAPWRVVGYVYLLRLRDGAQFTLVNSTWGCRKCVLEIRERVKNMTRLQGTPVLPVVKLASAELPLTKFPGKFRPELEIVSWRQADTNAPVEPPKLVAPKTAAAELEDEIPFD